MTINLLTEGGVAGHMNHLYDDYELTFSELKDILSGVSSGKIEGTEKTDGQNLFIAFDIKTSKAKGARNKTEITQGGLDGQGLSDKFSGRGALEFSFTDALTAFENVMNLLKPSEKQKIFGPNASIYFNCEVIDPRVSNVIRYDVKTLLIHRTGAVEFDPKTGQENELDVSDRIATLENALKRVQDQKAPDYKVQVDAIRRVEGSAGSVALGDAAKRIEAIMGSYGLSDNQTIGDFVILRLGKIVDDKAKIPNELKRKFIKKLLGSDQVNLADLKKEISSLPQDESSILMSMLKNDNFVISVAVKPIEEIVRNFSSKVLENLGSSFISNNKKEVKRIRDQVKSVIDSIQSSGDQKKIDSLKRQMDRLKDVNNIKSAIEGFVFSYNGKQFKLTGNFSPINQIIGLIKYDDKKASQNIEESLMSDKSQTVQKVALFPGSFKPPHRGHLSVVKKLCEDYDKVIVFVSNPRTPKKIRMGLDSEDAVKLFNLYIKDVGLSHKASAQVSSFPSSTVSALSYAENAILETRTKFFIATSTKDQNRFSYDLLNYQLKKNPMVESISSVVIPATTGPQGEISAKQIREILSSPFLTREQKEREISSYLPEGLEEETKKFTIKILFSSEDPSRVEEDGITEMSAAGAVGGYAGPAFVSGPSKRIRR